MSQTADERATLGVGRVKYPFPQVPDCMRFHRNLTFGLLLAALASITPTPLVAAVHPVRASHAMVASVHELASRAGVEMMQAGGNAVDAAVATGFALAVVHPQAGNLGGGGFMLIRMADGAVRFIDYREKAPAAATSGMYLDARGNVIENASLVGYRAIAVPGSVAGMVYAAKKYGKLPLARVMAPASNRPSSSMLPLCGYFTARIATTIIHAYADSIVEGRSNNRPVCGFARSEGMAICRVGEPATAFRAMQTCQPGRIESYAAFGMNLEVVGSRI